METHEIRYFVAVCETLNFTRAAERCNVSQPALTRAIQHLEDKLGGPLVHRERGNTHLTELGRIMRPYFQEVLQQMEEARRRAKTFAKLEKTRLDRRPHVHDRAASAGRSVLRRSAKSNDGVEIYLKDAPASALEDLLTKGEIDVAIFCRPDDLDDRFHTLPLYRERFVVAVAPGHPLRAAERGARQGPRRANLSVARQLRVLRLSARMCARGSAASS